jgi:hypothetical protein
VRAVVAPAPELRSTGCLVAQNDEAGLGERGDPALRPRAKRGFASADRIAVLMSPASASGHQAGAGEQARTGRRHMAEAAPGPDCAHG